MALFDFNSLPGLGSAATTAERVFLWGRHEQCYFRSIVLKSTATDNGNTPTTTIRAGMLLSQVSNKWVPYKSNASDGSQIAQGILAFDVKLVNVTTGAVGDHVAVVIVHGPVKASQLLYNAPVQATTTLTGLDPQARAQLSNQMCFDDQLYPNPNPWINVVTKGATGAQAYTVLASDSGTEFTTTGSDTSTTFTLPALTDANSNPICKGCIFRFTNTVNFSMVVKTAVAADHFVFLNDAGTHTTATVNTASNMIGATLEVRTDETGTKWLLTAYNVPVADVVLS